MAVPKKRTSHGKKGMRNSHNLRQKSPKFGFLDDMGRPALSHNILPDGTYKGRQIFTIKTKDGNNSDDSNLNLIGDTNN